MQQPVVFSIERDRCFPQAKKVGAALTSSARRRMMNRYRHLLRWMIAALALAACSAPGPAPAGPTPTIGMTPLPALPTPSSVVETSTPVIPSESAAPDLVIAGVRTVLDYYAAIADQRYGDAYGLWADHGAASGQSFEQFQQGFANTAGLRLIIDGQPEVSGTTVRVPIALLAIDNRPDRPDATQVLRRYRGALTVQIQADGATIQRASITPTDQEVLPPELNDAVSTLQGYYALLQQRRFAQAYTYWNKPERATGQDFRQFVQGFAGTSDLRLDLGAPRMGGAAGSTYAEIPVVVRAAHTDGAQQNYCGTYTLRRLNVPPFDQLGWRIEDARLQQLAKDVLSDDQLQQLLTNGCQR